MRKTEGACTGRAVLYLLSQVLITSSLWLTPFQRSDRLGCISKLCTVYNARATPNIKETTVGVLPTCATKDTGIKRKGEARVNFSLTGSHVAYSELESLESGR
jgi:hypothetical protein